MGQLQTEAATTQIDAWLRNGGLVVTASERAARFLTENYHRAQRLKGLKAWPTPAIQDWKAFVRAKWNERCADGRLVLNPLQEQSVWAEILASSSPQSTQLEGARQRLASLAMEAHNLVCTYAPRMLQPNARSGWDQDAADFSTWLSAFDDACRNKKLTSTARLPLELAKALQAGANDRPPLLLAGFDQILPTQGECFAAWGDCQQMMYGEAATTASFYRAADPAAELAACALWCKKRLAANPEARLLVVTHDAARRHGEIERAFLRHACANQDASGAAAIFEFSLGVPLNQVALARGASLLLCWLDGPIDEHEIDWLFSTEQLAASADESRALTASMRDLRRRGLQRTRWTLTEYLRQSSDANLPAAWVERMTQAKQRLDEYKRRSQSPLAWAELVPQLLEIAGWPGTRRLESAEFQALSRWQLVVDECASLGFDGGHVEWNVFANTLMRTVSETLFASESQNAPILIAGPAEAAGQTADGIWFLGADEDAWPARGSTNPLIPMSVQQKAGMPHATPQLDWELAEVMTRRLLGSTSEIRFSYARQCEGVEARQSRLVQQLAGQPVPVPEELQAPEIPAPLTVTVEDAGRLPFPPGSIAGGASVLTAQSQCPFKAFATARLNAYDWDPAEAGLTAAERGLLLHEVLHSIWSGPPDGIRTQNDLLAIAELRPFIEDHVHKTLHVAMPARARAAMPQSYLQLEAERLTDLVTDWLHYESSRAQFDVMGTEQKSGASVEGLTLRLRLDRIDRLNDGSLLVIDYKTGDVSPAAWDTPRPDDVQLPLYAGFALGCPHEQLGGLVFAKVRAGDSGFAGRVRDPKATLFPSLNGNHGLMRNKLTDEDLESWRTCIEQLALDFVDGRADVNPHLYPKTCEPCRLQALCRILEKSPQFENEDNEEEDSADA